MTEKVMQGRAVQTKNSYKKYENSVKEKEAANLLRYRLVEDENSIYEYDLQCLNEGKKKL